MRRCLLRWVVAAGLALCGWLPLASGDDLHPGIGNGPAPQSSQPTPSDAGDKVEKPPPTFAYFMAVAAAIVVLCIICVPSRKGESSTSRS